MKRRRKRNNSIDLMNIRNNLKAISRKYYHLKNLIFQKKYLIMQIRIKMKMTCLMDRFRGKIRRLPAIMLLLLQDQEKGLLQRPITKTPTIESETTAEDRALAVSAEEVANTSEVATVLNDKTATNLPIELIVEVAEVALNKEEAIKEQIDIMMVTIVLLGILTSSIMLNRGLTITTISQIEVVDLAAGPIITNIPEGHQTDHSIIVQSTTMIKDD